MEHRIMIAIVDDEDVFAEKIHEKVDGFLQNIGMDFEIRIFTDGTALLDSRSDVRFDLVFLDIDMPKITGIDIAKKLREMQADTEIVFVTNKDDLVYETIRYAFLGILGGTDNSQLIPHDRIDIALVLLKKRFETFLLRCTDQFSQFTISHRVSPC